MYRGLKQIGILTLLGLAAFIGPFGGNMVFPMFRPLKIEFEVEIFILGALITIYMLPFSFTQLFSGILSDLFLGRRMMIFIGFMLYGFGGLLAALSYNILILLIARVIQGIGNALSLPIAMALVGDLFDPGLRGKIMGFLAITTTLGAALGPLFGGFISIISWRLGFLAIAAISIGIGILFLVLLPPIVTVGRSGGYHEILGILRYNLMSFNVLAIGIVGFILFFTRVSINTYLSDLLTLNPFNLREEEIGALLSLSGIGGIISGFISGYLTDRIGRKTTALIGLLLLTPLLTIYTTNFWFSVLPYLLFIQGFLGTMVFTPVNTLAVEVNPKHRATVTSIYGSMRFLGYALGPMAAYPLYISFSIYGVAILSVILLIVSIPLIVNVKPRYS